MPSVALVHSRPEYAAALADAVNQADTEWVVEDLSPLPRGERIRQLWRGEYDAIQADEPVGNGVVAAVIGRLRGIPVIISLRGWCDLTNAHGEYSRLRMATIRSRTAFCLQAATQTLTLGSELQRQMARMYRRGMRGAERAPRPLDVEAYRAGHSLVTDGGGRTIVTVTNLRYEAKFEGVKTILNGIGSVLAEHPQARYLIAGAGAYFDELEQVVDAHPHCDQIEVLGYRDDVPDLLAEADVFAYASYLDAYPTAILEAQAAGVPVVAVDASGVPDAVGDAGYICADDAGAVGAAIGQVLSDERLRDRLAEESTARMDTYNARAADRYVEVWEASASN